MMFLLFFVFYLGGVYVGGVCWQYVFLLLIECEMLVQHYAVTIIIKSEGLSVYSVHVQYRTLRQYVCFLC